VQSLFGIQLPQAAQYLLAFAIVIGLVALFGLLLRRLTGGRLRMSGANSSRARQPRLGIVDIYVSANSCCCAEIILSIF
jgi:flagellar protein FliO/FliZ